MRYWLACATLLLCCGCGGHKKFTIAPKYSEFRTSTEPISKELVAAHADLQDAQKGVAGVDKAIPQTKEAQPLHDQLGEVNNKIESADAHVGQGGDAVKAHDAELDGLRVNYERVTKEHGEMIAEIARLNDDALNAAKHRLVFWGVLLIVGGVVSVVLSMKFGLGMGTWIGVTSGISGAALIAIAVMLAKIIWWLEITVAIGLAAFVAWVLWHFFWHHPPEIIPHEKDGGA